MLAWCGKGGLVVVMPLCAGGGWDGLFIGRPTLGGWSAVGIGETLIRLWFEAATT
jgi:hypothetical protein